MSMLVRRLGPDEWRSAFPVVAQLRQLDEEEFIRHVRRQSYGGYELVGAFHNGKLIGVMGMRPVHTLARGPHLHVDDLLVDKTARRSGAGRALLDFAEREARARGMTAIFLDARPESILFYEALSFVRHTSPSMRKTLA
jgi:GNAT superfamily N-acetyltransferase